MNKIRNIGENILRYKIQGTHDTDDIGKDEV